MKNVPLKYRTIACLARFIYLLSGWFVEYEPTQRKLQFYIASAAAKWHIVMTAAIQILFSKALCMFSLLCFLNRSEFCYSAVCLFVFLFCFFMTTVMADQTCSKHPYKEIIILYGWGCSEHWRNIETSWKAADIKYESSSGCLQNKTTEKKPKKPPKHCPLLGIWLSVMRCRVSPFLEAVFMIYQWWNFFILYFTFNMFLCSYVQTLTWCEGICCIFVAMAF